MIMLSIIAFQLASIPNHSDAHPTTRLLDKLPGDEPAHLSHNAKWTLYDPDPNHIWNRLYRALYARTGPDGQEYGYDELDPILWVRTKHLISGPSYQQAIKVLNEFLSSNAERLVSSPIKRAVFQHDLWAIFDWTTRNDENEEVLSQRRELQIRLAKIIRRLALSREQIQKLDNNYADVVALKEFAARYDADKPTAPFLPPDLFRENGEWVSISTADQDPVALSHVFSVSGRSAFRVFIHLPGGREATLKYITTLREFPQPWLQQNQTANPDGFRKNPLLPQFPAGTQLALIRQMILIDDRGNLVPTTLTEDVQIRVHRAIPTRLTEGLNTSFNEADTALDTYEFRLSREMLFAEKAGGLRALTRSDNEFPLFQSHDIDLFEEESGDDAIQRHLRPSLAFCAKCHFAPGIHSMLSYRPLRPKVSWSTESEAGTILRWKSEKYSWGLLNGLWMKESSAPPR